MRQDLAERSFQMLEFQAVTSEFHRLPFVPMVDIVNPNICGPRDAAQPLPTFSEVRPNLRTWGKSPRSIDVGSAMTEPQNSHSPSVVSDRLASSDLDVLPTLEPSASAARDQAKRLIEGASANFNEALTSASPVYFAVLGLDAILQAVRLCPDITQVAPLAAADISKNGLAMALRISDAVANMDLTDEIAVGLGAANALVTLSDDVLRYDRFLQVAMLLNNLRVHLCRSEIRRRGGLLMRHVDAHTAWNAADASATSLQ